MTDAGPKIVIVDDDASIRDSVRRLVSSLGYVAQVYGSAELFLQSLRSDIQGCIVLDIELPDLNGLELQARLTERGLDLPIIFLTGRADIPMSVRAMKAGAIEFLTKPFRSDQLVEAISTALSRDATAHIDRVEVAALRRRYEALTARERQVMARVIEGQLNKQIGADFGTSEATVKKQRGQVMAKMCAESVPDLVRIGARLALETAIPRREHRG